MIYTILYINTSYLLIYLGFRFRKLPVNNLIVSSRLEKKSTTPDSSEHCTSCSDGEHLSLPLLLQCRWHDVIETCRHGSAFTRILSNANINYVKVMRDFRSEQWDIAEGFFRVMTPSVNRLSRFTP